ncbi:MAG: polysaccharide deacetylase family protein, partial [Actinomycetota bacterium]
SPRRLAAQLALRSRLGLRGCSMRDLLAEPGRGRVGLTFDDGYRDFATTALPLLTAHGFTATVYALAGRLGGDNGWEATGPRKPLLTAPELRAVAAAGIEIGSHGLLHRHLPELSERELKAEVVESRAVLENRLQVPVTGFCYPYGSCGRRELDAVEAAGYSYGAAVGAPALPRQFAFPRTYAGEKDTASRLAAKYVRHLVRTR